MTVSERAPGLGSLSGRGCKGVRHWYLGAGMSMLFWSWPLYFHIWSDPQGVLWQQLGITLVVLVFFMVYALVPPWSWSARGDHEQRRRSWQGIAMLLGTNALVVLSMGLPGLWTWPFVSCAIAMTRLRPRNRILMVAALSLLAVLLQIFFGDPDEAASQGALILSLGMMMVAFAQQFDLRLRLEAAQEELAKAAVNAERDRMARDLHDILGHSLTVIAVKAELAQRLAPLDAQRAARECEEVTGLARAALSDVRATVAGHRSVNITAELGQARGALNAAGIRAELPLAVDSVSLANRELFGWVVREGVTNVIRHSGAGLCRITLSAAGVTVEDDGGRQHGVVPSSAAGSDASWTGRGSGLDGLADRIREAGGTLVTGRSELGGFSLAVTM